MARQRWRGRAIGRQTKRDIRNMERERENQRAEEEKKMKTDIAIALVR